MHKCAFIHIYASTHIYIYIYIYLYIYIYIYIYIYRLYMPLYLKMSENINETTRHLKFCYISILTNLLRTDNETKSVKTIYT